MPFQSESQRKLFWAKVNRGEISRDTAERWEHETPNKKKLPKKKRSMKAKTAALDPEYRKKRISKGVPFIRKRTRGSAGALPPTQVERQHIFPEQVHHESEKGISFLERADERMEKEAAVNRLQLFLSSFLRRTY